MSHKIEEENHAKSQAEAQLGSIVEMVDALEAAGDDDEKRGKVERAIHEDPLSVEVRTAWYVAGSEKEKPSKYRILLCWGGPAVQVIGDLSEHGEPETARIEYQDWGTPWTEYWIEDDDKREKLLTYARQFYFGE